MKLCKIENLKGKEILAKDIVTSDYQILLSSGNKLKKELIEKLPEYGIREVYIEDEKPDTRTVVILRDEVKEGFKSKVKDILEKIIDKNVDSLRFYYLGEKYKNKVEHIGAKETIKMDEPLIF